MLLKIALQMAHDDYTDRRERQRQGIALAKAAGRSGGRKGDRATHARIVALREAGKSIAKTAELADCDRSTVKRVWAAHRAAQVQEIGRAHVCTPVTNAHLVCRLLLETKKELKSHTV